MTEQTALAMKAGITTVLAGLSALWGWFGWLVVAWIGCMTIDYLTGYAAAMKNGEWSSCVAREGLWHKGGCIVVVLVAGILDAVVGYLLEHIPAIALPFHYTVFLTTLVVTWYILMELGSIIENVGKMGAPIPAFLQKAIAVLESSVDAAGEQMIPDSGETGEAKEAVHHREAARDAAERKETHEEERN